MPHSQTPNPSKQLEVSLPRNALWFSDRGLQVGATSLTLHSTLPKVETSEGPDRLEALLAIAFRRRLAPHVLQHIAKAAEVSCRGDQALANMRLALAGLSRVPAADDLPERLALANTLFAAGMTAGDLLAALGLGAARDGFVKYDPEQPRVPAGSGPQSGQWTDSGGDGAATSVATKPPVSADHSQVAAQGTTSNREAAASSSSSVAAAAIAAATLTMEDAPAVAPVLLPTLDAGLLAGLGAFAAAFGAAFGVLFVPWSKSISSSGTLPDNPDTTYRYDNEGQLQLFDQSGEIIASGRADASGIFYDAETGVPFARAIKDALMFDAAAMAAAPGEDEKTEAIPGVGDQAQTKDQPQLCPDPGLDVPHGASQRAIDYQTLISVLNNGEFALPPGFAVSLDNPVTGRPVVFDDCRERDGTMIEAKGPGYDKFLRSAYMRRVIYNRWQGQASRQAQAAIGHGLEWYIAEPGATEFARGLFAKNHSAGVQRIKTIYFPARDQ